MCKQACFPRASFSLLSGFACVIFSEASYSPASLGGNSPTRTLEFMDGRSSLGRSSLGRTSLGQRSSLEGDSTAGSPVVGRRFGSPGSASSSRRGGESEDEGETEEEVEASLGDADDTGGFSDGGLSDSGGVDEVADDDDASSANVVTDTDQRYDDDASRGRAHGDEEVESNGRRSRRTRFPPLAYWKNERYVYERPKGGIGEVLPTVAGVSERSKTPIPAKRCT